MHTTLANIVDSNNPITILDIGASLVGNQRPIYSALIDAKKARLIAFEPDAIACDALREEFPEPHAVLPYFIGDGARRSFYQTSWSATGSLYEPNETLLQHFYYLAELTKTVAIHDVQTTRLDEIDHCMDVDFLKIDVQGAETMIFEHGKRVLKDVTVIQTEVSYAELYRGQPLAIDVDRALRELGFVHHTRLGCGYRPFLPLGNLAHPQKAFNQELWADVVYVRDWEQFPRIAPDKLEKMAVLLHDLYRSCDLAHVALRHADAQSGRTRASDYRQAMLDSCAGDKGVRVTDLVEPQLSEAESKTTHLELHTLAGDVFSAPNRLECITTYVLLEQGTWFEKELSFVLRYLTGGMNAIDVGANLGMYAIPMARKIGSRGRVYAFEPGSEARSHLVRSGMLNGATNLEISASAIGDRAQTAHLRLNANSELNQLTLDARAEDITEEVAVETLDELFTHQRTATIDLIKIDAEGFEIAVLNGARTLLTEQAPLILAELLNGSTFNRNLIAHLHSLGYATYTLTGDTRLLVPLFSADHACTSDLNIFGIKAERAAELNARNMLAYAAAAPQLDELQLEAALTGYLNLPFTAALEIERADLVASPFGTAVLWYAAYSLVPDLSADQRWGLLLGAHDYLAEYCQRTDCAAGTVTLARICLDMGKRDQALELLRQVTEQPNASMDYPLYPAIARFEQMHEIDDPAKWMVASCLEAFEFNASYSSYYSMTTTGIELIAAMGYDTEALARRRTLIYRRRLDKLTSELQDNNSKLQSMSSVVPDLSEVLATIS